jgi:hypothetical protein
VPIDAGQQLTDLVRRNRRGIDDIDQFGAPGTQQANPALICRDNAHTAGMSATHWSGASLAM